MSFYFYITCLQFKENYFIFVFMNRMYWQFVNFYGLNIIIYQLFCYFMY